MKIFIWNKDKIAIWNNESNQPIKIMINRIKKYLRNYFSKYLFIVSNNK